MVGVTIDATRIEATGNHPFWVTAGECLEARPWPAHLAANEDTGKSLEGRWVNSQDLRPGDYVVSIDGRIRRVERVELWHGESVAVCNLSVRDHHTFAVGEAAILVHNTGWCDVLVAIKGRGDEMLKIRKSLAKKFGVEEKLIHGHHIVQKHVPEQYLSKKIKGILIKDYSAPDASWAIQDQMAWYIGQSQDILNRTNNPHVPIYGKSDFDSVEMARREALAAAARGEQPLNLTFAVNDKKTHSLETVREVWSKLNAAKVSDTLVADALRDLGERFMRGERVGRE